MMEIPSVGSVIVLLKLFSLIEFLKKRAIARQCLGNCVGQLFFADLNLDLGPVIVNRHGRICLPSCLAFLIFSARRRFSFP